MRLLILQVNAKQALNLALEAVGEREGRGDKTGLPMMYQCCANMVAHLPWQRITKQCFAFAGVSAFGVLHVHHLSPTHDLCEAPVLSHYPGQLGRAENLVVCSWTVVPVASMWLQKNCR